MNSKLLKRYRSSEISITQIKEAMRKYDKTGTADIVVGKNYGISIKDEGDFVSVRFGSNKLTQIGSTLSRERNFATKGEAFDFAEQIQTFLDRNFRSGFQKNHDHLLENHTVD